MVKSAIIVVAKCPIPGRSKTRLSKLVGDHGSALLAKAMLSDVLSTISKCSQLSQVTKILLYAPGTEEGKKHMSELILSLNLTLVSNISEEERAGGWILLPMMSQFSSNSSSSIKAELTNPNLGEKLTDALIESRKLLVSTEKTGDLICGSIVFLGMDSPMLPLSEIIYSCCRHSDEYPTHTQKHGTPVYLCPAQDGGYGMISIPHHVPAEKVFEKVIWSHSLTAVSQIKALTDNSICVEIGKLMHDVDEPEDLRDLALQLIDIHNKHLGVSIDSKKKENNDVLSYPSRIMQEGCFDNSDFSCEQQHSSCEYTWSTMIELGLIRELEGKIYEENFSV